MHRDFVFISLRIILRVTPVTLTYITWAHFRFHPSHFSSFLFYFLLMDFKPKCGLYSYHFRRWELIGENSNQWLSKNPMTQFLISVLNTTSLLKVMEKNIGYIWSKDANLLTSWSFPLLYFLHLLYLHSFYVRWKVLNFLYLQSVHLISYICVQVWIAFSF